jgi:hypothetical protein
MKALKVIGVLLAGPIVGFVLGAVGFGLTLPPDPASGDGIGVMLSGLLTAAVFFVISLVLVAKMSQKSSPELRPENDK